MLTILLLSRKKDSDKAAQFQTIGTRRFKDGIANLKNLS